MYDRVEPEVEPIKRGVLHEFLRGKGGRRYLHLAYNIYRSEKLRELLSFLLWELQAKVGLLRYIEFSSAAPVEASYDWSNLGDIGLLNEVDVTVSAITYKMVYVISRGTFIAVAATDTKTLIFTTDGQSIVTHSFCEEILSLFASKSGCIFVSLSNGAVYKSSDCAESFSLSLTLSDKGSYFRFAYGMTEDSAGTLYLGEYANVWVGGKWKAVPYLYCSENLGESWVKTDWLLKSGVNKHIHLIQYISFSESLILTDGDNLKRLWTGNVTRKCGVFNIQWKLITKFHFQVGGHTSCVEHFKNVILGTDFNGGTNFITRLNDGKFSKLAIPSPYKQCPIWSLQKRQSTDGVEIWASLHSRRPKPTVSLLMYSRDNGETWNRVLEYDGASHRAHICTTGNEIPKELVVYVTRLTPDGGELPLKSFLVRD